MSAATKISSLVSYHIHFLGGLLKKDSAGSPGVYFHPHVVSPWLMNVCHENNSNLYTSLCCYFRAVRGGQSTVIWKTFALGETDTVSPGFRVRKSTQIHGRFPGVLTLGDTRTFNIVEWHSVYIRFLYVFHAVVRD